MVNSNNEIIGNGGCDPVNTIMQMKTEGKNCNNEEMV